MTGVQSAIERVFVQADIIDAVLQALAEKVEDLPVGDPMSDKVAIEPTIRATIPLLARIRSLLISACVAALCGQSIDRPRRR